jgi:hypothetical protein
VKGMSTALRELIGLGISLAIFVPMIALGYMLSDLLFKNSGLGYCIALLSWPALTYACLKMFCVVNRHFILGRTISFIGMQITILLIVF